MAQVTARRPIRGYDNVLYTTGHGAPDASDKLGGPGSQYTDIDTGDRYVAGISGLWSKEHPRHNYAGVVRVNFTGLTVVGLVAEVYKEFNFSLATPTLAPEPTTSWPYGTVHKAWDPDVWHLGRLKEHPMPGQGHEWRITGTYANKAAASNAGLDIRMSNPTSGFGCTSVVTLPSNRTSGDFMVTFESIADNYSIPDGQGYILQTRHSTTDADLTVNITMIARFSLAVDNNP